MSRRVCAWVVEHIMLLAVVVKRMDPLRQDDTPGAIEQQMGTKNSNFEVKNMLLIPRDAHDCSQRFRDIKWSIYQDPLKMLLNGKI